jgi:hypothetical protein
MSSGLLQHFASRATARRALVHELTEASSLVDGIFMSPVEQEFCAPGVPLKK